MSIRGNSIRHLHLNIDGTSDMIREKTSSIETLYNKKLSMITSIESMLEQCRRNERALHERLDGLLSREGLSRLNEYNMYISKMYDEGSFIIEKINSAANATMLNEIENKLYEPFMYELEDKCSLYMRKIPTLVVERRVPTTVTSRRLDRLNNDERYERPRSHSYTHVETTGLGRTHLDIEHGNGVSVRTRKEDMPGSPAHDVKVATDNGTIKVTHDPTKYPGYVRPASPGPVFLSAYENENGNGTVVATRPVVTTPVVRAVPVRTVTPVQEYREVKTVAPVQEYREVKTVAPVQKYEEVKAVAPVQEYREIKTMAPVQNYSLNTVNTIPVSGGRAVVTHDYYPVNMNGNKMAVRAGTTVNVLQRNGEWSYVQDPSGRRGYVSSYYLR